jgi:hypothetical protein
MPAISARTIVPAVVLAAGGMVVGGVLAGTLSASAAESPSPTASGAPSGGSANGTPGPASGETPLTGDTLAKVKAAVTAKYPGATFVRVETDSDGVYEAHITKADGTQVTVEVGKDFTVTGEESHGQKG